MLRIKEAREERGISGIKMAELLNVSAPHYYDMEKGHKRIHAEMLNKIADILGFSVDFLLGRDINITEEKSNVPGGGYVKLKYSVAKKLHETGLPEEKINDLIEESIDTYNKVKNLIESKKEE